MQDLITADVVETIADDAIDSSQYLPGSFGCHAAMDRTSLLADMVGNLAEHPAIKLNPEWSDMADKACELLCELYQKIGAAHL